MRKHLVFLVFFGVGFVSATERFSCNSSIYCHGELLRTVQLSRIFSDSKTFVDKRLLHAPEKTLSDFDRLLATNPDKKSVAQFVENNFADGNELNEWIPTDYKEDPVFLRRVRNDSLRNFAQKLVKLWPTLARKVKDDVRVNPQLFSIIWAPRGFVIPGGRFREYYYWDSYWIIRGLLISDMSETAKGMIENFFSLVDRFGFVPNGGRIYYLNRSQPPLLAAMVRSYFDATSDTEWLKNNIGYLERELEFWLTNRTTTVFYGGRNITLARYRAASVGPRPESYFEDYETASKFSEHREQVYVELKSGAESGWDFSSRWFFDERGGTETSLINIKTSRVLPVDLNAILCGGFRTLSELYLKLNDSKRSARWAKIFQEWKTALNEVFWDENDGIWYDFDVDLRKRRRSFYASNVAPLWTRCYDDDDADKFGSRVATYLKNEKILDYLGGVPTSLEQTGEQWDFPNAWPPLQDIVVEGLRTSGNADAVKMAETFARRWMDANLLGFAASGEMFEKYDAVSPGKYGGGGEYVVQTGFGWSNGVALKFIYEYFSE